MNVLKAEPPDYWRGVGNSGVCTRKVKRRKSLGPSVSLPRSGGSTNSPLHPDSGAEV